jgi:curved DNA-binding protein CbpA
MKTPFENYYEALQLSPRADQVMINKAYRLLAAYYHPDHTQTGNEEKFKSVLRAHDVLSDPARRMQYDQEYARQMAQAPAPMPQLTGPRPGSFAAKFQKLTNREEPEEDQLPSISERELRRLILLALYDVRRNHPQQPEVNLLVLCELVGAAVQHMDFSRWYLKEKGLIKMDESANLMITVQGVDFVESELLPETPVKNQLYLPEPRTPRPAPASSLTPKR